MKKKIDKMAEGQKIQDLLSMSMRGSSMLDFSPRRSSVRILYSWMNAIFSDIFVGNYSYAFELIYLFDKDFTDILAEVGVNLWRIVDKDNEIVKRYNPECLVFDSVMFSKRNERSGIGCLNDEMLLDIHLCRIYVISQGLNISLSFSFYRTLTDSLREAFRLIKSKDFRRHLKSLFLELKEFLADGVLDSTWENYERIIEFQSLWTEKLHELIANYRYIGCDSTLSKKDVQVLKSYYEANIFLLECLNTECYLSREVRKEIEDTLFLPYDEIQKYKAAKA